MPSSGSWSCEAVVNDTGGFAEIADHITAYSYIRKICMISRVEAALLNSPFRLPAAPVESDLLSKYFRVLGDATRLRILDLVAEEERSVGELAALLGESQPKVSNHLACLRWCGFVVTRREHRTVYYRVADERVGAVIALGRELLRDNEEHVAACHRVDRPGC
jgi:ArsR family transcriptional regulator, cadmium/lead-responsive transcriptional repressor